MNSAGDNLVEKKEGEDGTAVGLLLMKGRSLLERNSADRPLRRWLILVSAGDDVVEKREGEDGTARQLDERLDSIIFEIMVE